MEPFEFRDGDLLLSSDKELLDIELIHAYLSQSYWSPEITKEIVIKAIQHSLAFGLYKSGLQIGYCRLITDYATFAYLADVFIVEAEKAKGFGQFLMTNIRKHPELKGLRKWLLSTQDAHSL
ncbi:MAG: hypothetical protein ACI9IP_001923 [Arcticibacterium sp.]|jgi:hypothetical protein